jgi:pyridoxal 5'-phosphate synthase pdxT subunit
VAPAPLVHHAHSSGRPPPVADGLHGLRADGQFRPHADDLPPADNAPAAGRRIGVLALQGAFAEHAVALRRLGAEVVEVRLPRHLELVDSLVMPGGESTTMSKLLVTSGLFDAISSRLAAGALPVFGTCAGMILLADHIVDGRPDQKSFRALNISVQRNGYGRQIDSFEAPLTLLGDATDTSFIAVFIRAPKITSASPDVDILASHEGVPVLVAHGPFMASSFHPELTTDLRVHRMFVSRSAAHVPATRVQPTQSTTPTR